MKFRSRFVDNSFSASGMFDASWVFESAINYYRTSAPDLKEERAMLLEEWLNLERSSGELGYVSLVRAKLPKKLKKRRRIDTDNGGPFWKSLQGSSMA